MKKKTYAIFLTFLSLLTLSAALIIGGADPISAQERFEYEITAENNRSKIVTVMKVFASNERDAKENVAANGWKILSIRQLTYQSNVQVPIQIGEQQPTYVTVGNDLPQTNAEPKPPQPQLTDEELILSILGPPAIDPYAPPIIEPYASPIIEPYVSSPTGTGTLPGVEKQPANVGAPVNGEGYAQIPPPAGFGVSPEGERYTAYIEPPDGRLPMNGFEDFLNLTPDAGNLEHLFTIYFDLGIIAPNMSPTDNQTIASLNKERNYYVFGNTDDVPVIANRNYTDNFDLSFKRAEAIKGLMVALGINPANVNTAGLGYLYPRVVNRSGAAGTPENRRVEVYGARINY